MKNKMRTIIIALAISLVGVSMAACTPSPNVNYTGTAVITSHRVSSEYCRLTITFPDGSSESRKIPGQSNRRTKCNSVKDGGTVTLENGRVKDYEKK